jgi:anti-anti-sigma regulatory factor
VLDLSGLPSIEASTLGSILLLRQALRAAGGGLRLRGCSDAVTSALRGMHLERILCPEEE